MSIWTSLLTGSSGLAAHGEAISAVGDNIANISTVGYRGSRSQFDEMIGGTAANGQNQGIGVHMSGTETSFVQGSLSATGRALDLAIRGAGLFAVSGRHNGIQGNYFTRDGRFSINNAGTIVNSEGLKLQGYIIDGSGKMATNSSDLNIGGISQPRSTTQSSIFANLDANAPILANFSAADPSGTSNYATSVTVFDSLGASHRVDMYFHRNGAGDWEWHGMADGGELQNGTKGVATQIANGTMNFTASGALNTATLISSNANFVGAVPNQSIRFTFGDPIATGGTGFAGTTQFSSASSVKAINQDGYGAGTLVDVSVNEDGLINGRFSNGQTRAVARVALATFGSHEGLQRMGSQLFVQTVQSGAPLIDAAATSRNGSIVAGSVEGSNVDLGNELITLIAYQRAFTANSKIVTTADEMLAEVTNLKR